MSESYFLKDSLHVDSAMIIIKKGLKNLGSTVITLQQQLMKYLKSKKDIPSIIELYDTIIQQSQRKETPYYQKAIYLYELQKYREAQIALEKAKMSYSQLHRMLKRTNAMTQLVQNIQLLENQIRKHVKH